jgi:hypothetical protein
LTQAVLKRVLTTLAFCFYEAENVPVLFFPHTPDSALNIEIEKYYDLWIMDTEFSDHFIQYLPKPFRCRKKGIDLNSSMIK